MKYTRTMKNINYNTQLAIHNIRYVESKLDDKCSVVNQQHRIAIVFVVSVGIKGFWHCCIKLYVVHHMCYVPHLTNSVWSIISASSPDIIKTRERAIFNEP